MEKEKPMPNTNRHRMIVQSFVISKPEQVHHFQIRLPRNAKQVVAIDYDVFVKATGTTATHTMSTGDVSVLGNTLESAIAIPKSLPIGLGNSTEITTSEGTTSDMLFNWNSTINPSIGTLKLQSLETANIFYSEWIKLLEWNNGFTSNGVLTHNPYSLLQKQKPKQVEVSPQTTLLNGLYEDFFLTKTNRISGYMVNVCVWLEMNEPSNGVEFEFLKTNKRNA